MTLKLKIYIEFSTSFSFLTKLCSKVELESSSSSSIEMESERSASELLHCSSFNSLPDEQIDVSAVPDVAAALIISE